MNGGILVVAEHLRGEVADITYEMLGIGRKIADSLSTKLTTVLIGKGIAPLANKLGKADMVLTLDSAAFELPSPEWVAGSLASLVGNKSFDLILLGGTNLTLGVGAILAAKTKLPYTNFCRDIKVSGGLLLLTSQLFGGKILADVPLAGSKGIINISPGYFPADEGKSERSPAVESIAAPTEAPKITFMQYIEPDASDVDITKVELLVAVGRGVQNADNIGMAEELAGVLGGAVCASRPVVDQGWLPMTRQVGKSGMSVKPRLYLALGISGAPEHEEGMKNSRLIIAINTDPNAPIFGVAKYGVNADLLDILPPLTEEIKKRK